MLGWDKKTCPETVLRLCWGCVEAVLRLCCERFEIGLTLRWYPEQRLVGICVEIGFKWDWYRIKTVLTRVDIGSSRIKRVLRLCWDKIETVLRLCWDKIETVLRLWWDKIETVLRLWWDKIETVLRLCWDSFETGLSLSWYTVLGYDEMESFSQAELRLGWDSIDTVLSLSCYTRLRSDRTKAVLTVESGSRLGLGMCVEITTRMNQVHIVKKVYQILCREGSLSWFTGT